MRVRWTLVIIRRLGRKLGRGVQICGISMQGLEHPTRAFRFAMHYVGGYPALVQCGAPGSSRPTSRNVK